jgi:hypothetical protein
MKIDKQLAEKIRNLTDEVVVDEITEDTFRDILLASGRITEDRYYELSEIYYALDNESRQAELEKIDRANPVLGVDDRAALKALKLLDLSKIPGYFPHVEEHGTKNLTPEENEIMELLKTMRNIAEDIYSGWGTNDEKQGIEMILAGMRRFENFMIKELGARLGLNKAEIKLEIQNHLKKILEVKAESAELKKKGKPTEQITPPNVIKFPGKLR